MDYSKIKCKNGKLDKDSPVQVGSIVAVFVNGQLKNGIVKKFRQQNYLPRFFVLGKWRGKIKLRDALPEESSKAELERLLEKTTGIVARGVLVRMIHRWG